MSEKKTKSKKPNILRVALRLLIIAVCCAGAFYIYRHADSGLSTLHYAGIGALLLAAAVVLVQLIVWGLKWVGQERVSELGLHIVRYAVILASVALCVFVLLSYDYSGLYSVTMENELRQQALAGRMYVQSAIGGELDENAGYSAELAQKLDSMILSSEDEKLNACIYLKMPAPAEDSAFTSYDGGFVCRPVSAGASCRADVSVLDEAFGRGEVILINDHKIGTASATAAYSPVYTKNGEPVGVLELYRISDEGLNIFHFATPELCLKLLALIVFFSFSFYGWMQLVDIALRPRKFDKSRRVLSCGRESARPVLFFVAVSAALPIMMLLFADNIRSLMDAYALPWDLGVYVPFIVYLAGICIGQLFGSIDRPTLSEIPADAGLVFSFLCNLGLCLFMDWNRLSGLGLGENVILMLVLIFVSGLGYGIAYRVTAKFQAQSDALFGYDKYAYLCSCLGAMSGIVLGGLIIEKYSNVLLRVVSCGLTALTAAIAIILLEDLKATVDTDENYRNEIRSYAGLIFGIIPVGLACCFVWMYLTGYMFENDISVAAIAFCAVAPVIAFCFGNRLRVKNRAGKRTTLVISAIISVLAFVPMIVAPSFNMAILSCVLVCIAVIFAASAVYSMARHGELRKLTARLTPLAFIGMILAAFAYNVDETPISLGSAAAASLLCMLIFILSKFPPKAPPKLEFRPGITDGTVVVHAEPAVSKAVERENRKKQKEEEKARAKAEKEAAKADKEAAKQAEKDNKKQQREDKKKDKAPAAVPVQNDSDEKPADEEKPFAPAPEAEPEPEQYFEPEPVFIPEPEPEAEPEPPVFVPDDEESMEDRIARAREEAAARFRAQREGGSDSMPD